jgi:hypothetical protein
MLGDPARTEIHGAKVVHLVAAGGTTAEALTRWPPNRLEPAPPDQWMKSRGCDPSSAPPRMNSPDQAGS